MFISLLAQVPLLDSAGAPVAQGSLQAFPIWGASLLLFVAVFAVLMVRKVVQETARMREENVAGVERDEHIIAVPGLGTTMADGGDVEGGDKQ